MFLKIGSDMAALINFLGLAMRLLQSFPRKYFRIKAAREGLRNFIAGIIHAGLFVQKSFNNLIAHGSINQGTIRSDADVKVRGIGFSGFREPRQDIAVIAAKAVHADFSKAPRAPDHRPVYWLQPPSGQSTGTAASSITRSKTDFLQIQQNLAWKT
jgi:hypothetical protein